MAGATKCYKVWKDHEGNLQKRLVEHHPKYATRGELAVQLVRTSNVAYVAPTDWLEFEADWYKEQA